MIRSNRRLSTRRRSDSTSGATMTANPDRLTIAVLADGYRGSDGPPHQFTGADVVERQFGRTGIEPRDLQQVVDHAPEPGQIGFEQREGSLRLRRQLPPVGLEHAHGRRKVVRGDRSSWLTSEVNRASRSIRPWRLPAMRLNEPASAFRSASSPASTLVPNCPPAMATAASEIPDSGRRTRPLAQRPTTAPAMVVTTPPPPAPGPAPAECGPARPGRRPRSSWPGRQ